MKEWQTKIYNISFDFFFIGVLWCNYLLDYGIHKKKKIAQIIFKGFKNIHIQKIRFYDCLVIFFTKKNSIECSQ